MFTQGKGGPRSTRRAGYIGSPNIEQRTGADFPRNRASESFKSPNHSSGLIFHERPEKEDGEPIKDSDLQ